MSARTDHRGLPEEIDPSDIPALDLLRLRQALKLLGVSAKAVRLKLQRPLRTRVKRTIKRLLKLTTDLDPKDPVGPRSQLNQYFGARLGDSTAQERSIFVKAFTQADAALPSRIRQGESHADTPAARTIREAGCVSLGRTLDDAQIDSIHAHLRSRPLFIGHDAHTTMTEAASLDEVPADSSFACHDYLDLWSSPHIVELATQGKVLDLAQAYLGCTPTLYSINAFWSLPNRQPHPYTQVFHRDWEDFRSFVVFTQLTPVEKPEDGAHYYVEKSHEVDRFESSLQAAGIDRANLEPLLSRDPKIIGSIAAKLFGDTARRFDGPAGQSFCTDGYGLHRALVPSSKPRLLLWMRFGTFFNEKMYTMAPKVRDPVAAQRILARIPATPRHRYIFRHMIEALSSV
jgi:hypothetical protein